MSDRVDRLLGRLRREEKLRLVQGRVDPAGRATGYVPPVERLGIPACSFTDGPLGVRYGRATAFPASVALAAAWDPDLAERFGRTLASEARAKGFDGVLAPGLNVARVPQCGRLFEYLGEDPHLAARVAGRTVAGIESMDVLSSPKHYIANNQEHARLSVSADVGERALREVYLPAVEAAVDAGAGTVMAAYNRVNGVHMTQHERLLTDVLKDELGFEGVVVSDWWAVHDPAAAAGAGLDLEMPGATLRDLLTDDAGRPVGPRQLLRQWPPYLPLGVEDLFGLFAGQSESPGVARAVGRSTFAGALGEAVDRGAVPASRLDDMVRRLLGQYERIGLLGDADRPTGALGTAAHRALARGIAVRGTVLLKNDGLLPFDDADTVALVGPGADRAKVGGGGSSRVTPFRRTSPLDGLRDRVGADRVAFERGCAPVATPRSVRGLVGRLLRSTPTLDDAVAAADRADVAVVVVRDDAAEGRDRPSLALPGEQDRLVSAVAATTTPTVVVLETAGPVEMPWLDRVDAVLETWYGGQETGAALAATLFGDADPGGRLPVTFGRAAADYPAKTRAQYPGRPGRDGRLRAAYDEGVFVGYRHFDRAGTAPAFPFGHGLSYADFDYDDLSVSLASGAADGQTDDSPGSVTVTVENVADRRGREVVQVYVGVADGGGSNPERLPRPPRELAGFVPVELDAGRSARIEVPLRPRAFAVYGEEGWTVDAREYAVEVGRSSRDRRLATTVTP